MKTLEDITSETNTSNVDCNRCLVYKSSCPYENNVGCIGCICTFIEAKHLKIVTATFGGQNVKTTN